MFLISSQMLRIHVVGYMSLEVPCWGTANECPRHIFQWALRKKIFIWISVTSRAMTCRQKNVLYKLNDARFIITKGASLSGSDVYLTRPSCSKLTTSLVNDSLKFTSSDTQICWIFFAEKMWVAAVQKLFTFFQQKISEYCILNLLKQLTKWPLMSLLS